MDLQEALDVLNPSQREAVVHVGKSLLILAGAGSGKTRVITTKIAWLIKQGISPNQILAVTFTKKAAEEMRQRAIALDQNAQYAQIRTFHSFGAFFLRTFGNFAGLDQNFTVYDDDDTVSLLMKAVPDLKKKDASYFAHRIALAKDYCLNPDSTELDLVESAPEFRGMYQAYEERLRQTGNCDFGDLIKLPYEILRDNEFIRNKIHDHFKVIMVDEYQDSNVAQFKLLAMLSGAQENDGKGCGTYVCVVGDDDQSIYKFRGAEVQNILNFQNQFPGTDLIRLEENYRSTTEILECAGSVVGHNKGRLGKTLVACRGSGKKPALVFLPNQDDESEFCYSIIEQAHEKGVPYSDWAILYRTNAQSLGFETEFLHRKIPYQVVGSLKFFEREEVKDAVCWLSFVLNPKDEISFRRIINKPVRGIGGASQDKIVEAKLGESLVEAPENVSLTKKAMSGYTDFCNLVKEFSEMLPEGSVRDNGDNIALASEAFGEASGGDSKNEDVTEKLSVFVEKVISRTGLEEFHKNQDEISGTQKLNNLQELVNSALLYPCTKLGLVDFLDHINLDRTLAAEENIQEDCVTLITLHNTKGLEFPRVIITGMENGIFPRSGKTEAELEEERRLFYVGITRARDELYLTSCSMRRMYGKTDFMIPSPFLSEIGKDMIRVLGDKPGSFSFGDGETDPIKKKYKKGAFVFHDDYGHGQIIGTAQIEDGEYCVTVKFQSGGVKKFLPKYQSSSLVVVEDF